LIEKNKRGKKALDLEQREGKPKFREIKQFSVAETRV
jgi:hypothetical protein